MQSFEQELERDARWLERQREKEEQSEWWEAFDEAVKDDPTLLQRYLKGELS